MTPETDRRLERDGWSTVELPDAADLRVVATWLRPDLERSRIEIERVSPKRRQEARPGTMSALYGLGPFPLHTERAHWPRPPRYVVFRSVGARTVRPTTLLDSNRLAADPELIRRLHDVPWRVAWDGAAFEARVLTAGPRSQWRIRYDRCCMTVSDPALQGELEEALDRLPLERHQWKPDTALVIDNWRVLHGRGGMGETPDDGRVLERVVVP